MKKCLMLAFLALAQFWAGSVAAAPLTVSVARPDAVVKYQAVMDQKNKLLVSVLDAEENPVTGLTEEDFSVQNGRKTAQILRVEPFETSRELGLNLVLVIDNSASMKQRKAVTPLLTALEEVFKIIRPIDNLKVVVFDEKGTMSVDGRELHTKVLQAKDATGVRALCNDVFASRMTSGTYLYDAMITGLDLVRNMPEKSHKLMVVFSDGDDINSVTDQGLVAAMAGTVNNLSAYAVDYMDTAGTDPFLEHFSKENNGRVWKASSAAQILPIFKAFSTTLLHRYILTYRFANPPLATAGFNASKIVIEEVTTVDSAPLLNHIYFEAGQSVIPAKYVLYPSKETRGDFSEANLRGGMEKYLNILNVIGKRMQDNPSARIRIVGCNANVGEEKGKTDLSKARAVGVQAYLTDIWGIDPARMDVEARNLPRAPSTNRLPEGQAENRRVEILSETPAIIEPIRSVYVEKAGTPKELQLVPHVDAEAGIAHWKLALTGGNGGDVISSAEGQGDDLPEIYSVGLDDAAFERIAAFDHITASLTVTDREGEVFTNDSVASVPVQLIRREEQQRQKEGYKVLEKYALILFDYDSAAVKDTNRTIVDRIIARVREVPGAEVTVTGHTDNIGKENYNVKLSERRAKSVNEQMGAEGLAALSKAACSGVGPRDPLYDNTLPEGRALNRTVTVSLEYESREAEGRLGMTAKETNVN